MKLGMALCFGSAALCAAIPAVASGDFLRGVYIGRMQERLITAGMKCDEVRTLLGNPAARFDYRANDGPTWTYYLVDSPAGNFVFDIQFNADCRVASKGERVVPSFG